MVYAFVSEYSDRFLVNTQSIVPLNLLIFSPQLDLMRKQKKNFVLFLWEFIFYSTYISAKIQVDLQQLAVNICDNFL